MAINTENLISWLVPLLPFLFTLFVFGLTRLLDFRRDQLQIRKELIRNQIFVEKWVELIELQVCKQLKTLDVLLENFKNNKYENFIQFNLLSEKLSILSSKERLNLFVVNRNGNLKDLSSLFFEFEISTENMNGIQNNIEKAFGYSRTAIFEVFAEWDENMQDLNNAIDRLILPKSESFEVKAIIDELYLTVHSLSGEVGIPIPELKIKLIEPVTDLLIRLYAIRKYDDFFYSTSRTIRTLNMLVIKYNNSKETSFNQFGELKTSLTNNIIKLKNVSTEIFNHKLKYFLTLK